MAQTGVGIFRNLGASAIAPAGRPPRSSAALLKEVHSGNHDRGQPRGRDKRALQALWSSPFFTMPDNRYWALGEVVADAWSIGEDLSKKSG